MTATTQELRSIAPATGQALGAVIVASADDVERLIAAARAAQWEWWRRGAVQRAALLIAVAALLDRDRDEIARLMAAEVGKPLRESTAEVARASQILSYYGGVGRELGGFVRSSADASVDILARQVPVGVAAVISPWNFPVAIPVWKIAPALASGCTVVWKPAPEAALTAERVARAFEEAGMPRDVLGIAQGGGTVGAALVDGDIDALSFTGSTGVGERIGQQVGGQGRPRLTLELGGVNVAHVLRDADVDRAAADIAAAAYGYAGQKCTATQVVAVDRTRLDEFVPALERAAGELAVGDPLDSGTAVGPVISADEGRDLRARVAEAARAAPHAWEGEAPEGPAFVAPTLLLVDQPDSPLLGEEFFGPVAAVIGVDSDDDRRAVASASGLGLAAAVYGRDEAEIRRVVNRLSAGVIAINRPSTGLDPHVPFGGWNGSGGAFFEQGTEGLRFYLKWQTQYWRTADVDAGWV